MTGRCRRAEVRDASVGLNVSNALDVGARAVRGKVGNAEGRRRVLSLLSPSPVRARSLTLAHPRYRATLMENAALNPHGAPPHRPVAPPLVPHATPIDLAATHFTSRRGWNKVPPGGMVTPRRRRRQGRGGGGTHEGQTRDGEPNGRRERKDGGEEGLEG